MLDFVFHYQHILHVLVCFSVISCTHENSLPGSCIVAGYNSCCSAVTGVSSCHGEPPTCFCDPSCREFQDCCSDLDEICEPVLNPEVLSSVKPVFLFAHYITFHSATLQWATSSLNHTILGVNVTYVIKYHQLSSASNVEVKAINVHMDKTTEYYVGDGLYGVVLTQLKQNMTYSSWVEVFVPGVPMTAGTNTVSFETLVYPSVQELKTKLHNISAVRLSWDHLELPLGVKLSHYTLYYGVELELSHQFGFQDNCGMIGGLQVRQQYHFSITATIVEVDGSVLETVRSTVVPMYIPECNIITLWYRRSDRTPCHTFNNHYAVLFQLNGRYPRFCFNWDVDSEKQLISSFQVESAHAIRTRCRCPYPDANIKETFLLCQDDESNQLSDSSFATFRATALSTVNITIPVLLNHLTDWVSQEPVLHFGIESVKLESRCSTLLRLGSDPLCSRSVGHNFEGNSDSLQSLISNNTTAETCISLPIFLAAIAAELLFFLAVLLVGIIAVLKLSSRNKHAIEEGSIEMASTQRQAVQNAYEISHIVNIPTDVHTEQHLTTTEAERQQHLTTTETERQQHLITTETEGQKPFTTTETDQGQQHLTTTETEGQQQ